jgi:tyrosyl-tRNA synthetase
MWGMDANGLRVLTPEEESAVRETGAMTEHSSEFTFLELFKTIFPFQDKWKTDPKTDKKERLPQSKKSLTEFAKQGALKWGNLPISVEDLEIPESTNQDFVVLSIGKKKREMVFFHDSSS